MKSNWRLKEMMGAAARYLLLRLRRGERRFLLVRRFDGRIRLTRQPVDHDVEVLGKSLPEVKVAEFERPVLAPLGNGAN